MFQILGVPAMLGRTFTDAELADPASHGRPCSATRFWQRRFGGDPGIVGRTIQLNGAPTTVVGVMPPDVQLLTKLNRWSGRPTDLWVPYPLPESARTPRGRSISVVARLKPGVSIAQAQAQMTTIAAGLAAEFPQFDTGWTRARLSRSATSLPAIFGRRCSCSPALSRSSC